MVADVVDGLTGGERRVENDGLVSPEEAEELDLVGEGERRTPGAEAALRCPPGLAGLFVSNLAISSVALPGGGRSRSAPGSVVDLECDGDTAPPKKERREGSGVRAEERAGMVTPETGRDCVPSVLSVILLSRNAELPVGGGYDDAVEYVGVPSKDGSDRTDCEPV